MKTWHVIILCALCSCGTSKRSTEAERYRQAEIELSDSLFWRDKLERTELRMSEEMLNARIIITNWSQPDSIGRQYPTKTTEIDMSRQKNESDSTKVQSGSNAIQVKKQDIKIQDSETVKEDVKKDSRLVPVWVWWVLALGCAVAVLLAWMAKKRK